MKKENLYCLIANNELTGLTNEKVSELPYELEIDLNEEVWVNDSGKKVKIGKYQPCFKKTRELDIRFVYDCTNIEHITQSQNVAADFHR